MATPNVGILTTAGKALIDKVNSGQAKISFSKIVFSSMDNSQLSDMQVKALTAIAPQEVVVSSPETTLDTNSGETRIRATGTNEKLADGVYVKTYGVFAKDDTGSEILYGVTVSPNPNYFPAYDGVTPQAVTYSYKTVIQETSNITMTNSNDVYASQEDLAEALQPYAKTVDVNQQLDKKVNVSDMRKPASDVAGIEEVNAKQDKIGYTPADDSTVVHLSGANNFDTIPTVKNNPLLLASSLPSDLAQTTKDANFTGKLQKSGIDVATKSDVTTAVSTATANMVDYSKPTNFTAGLKSGGIDVATAADLKSVEASAWRPIISNNYSGLCMMKYNAGTNTMSLSGTIFPQTYSKEGSRIAVIIPMPQGVSMGENTNSQTNIWLNVNTSHISGVLADLNFENDGIHIIFDKIYNSSEVCIILDGFFGPFSTETSSFINFNVIKN